MNKNLDLEFLINCYSKGIFPMADDRYSDEINFYQPQKRGIIPLQCVKVSKSLIRSIKKKL